MAIESAVKDSYLDTLIERLEGGWNAAVGPRGRRLSGYSYCELYEI